MSNDSTTDRINLHDLVMAMSRAIGLAGAPDFDHCRRVACVALNLAGQMGLTPDENQDLRVAALLHDAAVTQNREHRSLRNLDWTGPVGIVAMARYCCVNTPRFHGWPTLWNGITPVGIV